MENITFSHRARSQMKRWTALLSFVGMSLGLHANPNPNIGRSSLAYCTPAATSTASFIKDFSTTGGGTNISNLNSGLGSGGYANHTAMTVGQYAGASVSFRAVYNSGTFGLAVWVDWNNNETFEASERMFHTTSYSSSQNGTLTVPAGTALGSYRMRVLADFNKDNPDNPCGFNSGRGEAEDYTFQVVAPPSCLPPSDLGTGNVTFTTAQFSWLGEGTVFDVEYGPAGFAQGTGTMASSVGNPYDATGLTPDTSYQFYVRRACSTTDKSSWAGPFRFYTGYCLPAATSTTNFIKDFSTTGGSTNISNLNTGQGTGGYANHTTMTVGQYAGASVSFRAVYNDGTFGLAIWIDWNRNMVFESAERMFNTTGYSSSQNGTLTVPAGTALGSYRMRVLADFNKDNPDNPCGFNSGKGEAEDYTFQVVAPPSCLPPSDLGTGNVTFTTAQFSWLGEGTVFDVEYGPAGFAQGTGTMASSVGNPYDATGLTPDTSYQFYVRRACSTTDKSSWAGPFRFYTGYCLPIATGTSNYIKDFSTTGGYANISNLNTGQGAGGYANHTTMKVSHYEGRAVNFRAVYNSGTFGLAIWIDWNRNMVFESAERMFNTTGFSSSQNGTITIPAGTPVGNYRMRVLADFNKDNPENPCGFNSGNGEVEDYTLEVVTPPTCMPPTELGAGNVTFTTAQFSWLGEGTVFDVEYGPAGFTQGTGTMASSVGNPYDATGLTPDTSYQFYVRRACSTTDKSPWAGPFRFYTGYCLPAATGTSNYIKDFSTTGGYANISNLNTGQGAGGYANHTTMKVSHYEGRAVNFRAVYNSGTFGLAIWIDWNRNMVFESAERMFNTTGFSSSQNGTITIPAGTPVGNYRMRVLADFNKDNPENPCGFNSGNGEVEDYTLEVVTPPTCMPPTELGAGNVTFTTAQFSWLGEGTVFDVEYGPAGFAQGTGTMASSVGNPYDATGLTPDTSYQFYVRRACSTTDKSPWAGPFRFYTGYCLPVATGTSNYIKDFSTTGGYANISNLNTGQGAGGYANHTTMKVSHYEGRAVNFRAVYNSGTFGLAIWIDWNRNMVFESAERMFNTTGFSSSQNGTITIPAGTPVGNYRMRVLADFNKDNPENPCGFNSGNGEVEDYTFEVVAPPTCMPPTDLGTGNVTFTTAQFSWLGEGTVFDVEYGPAGFAQGTGTMASSVGNPYNATGLTSDTAYQFYVRRDCGAGDKSPWAGPFRFFTGYCLPAATGTSNYIKDFSTTGGYANITNLNTGQGTGGYANHTNMAVSQHEGASVDFSAVYNGGTFGLAIWIDWNRNMVFETSERMFQTAAYSSSQTGTITVPAGTAVGSYRMRVLADFNRTNPDNPCGFNTGNGEVEDYTFEVATPPSCLAPSALAANVTTTTAQLSWNSSGTVFDIEYGPRGFVQGSGTMAAGIANPHPISGLTANTPYQFYVRTNCGAGDLSTWAGPFTFTTACGAQTVPYLLDFNEVTIPALPLCTSIQNAGTGNNWKTDNVNGWGFASKLLNYSYNSSNPANAWFYTNGIQLEAGTNYTLKFQYGNSGTTTYVERLKVNIATSADYNAMTRNIVDYPEIINSTPLESSTTFTVETSGVYYLGFNAYSITDRAQIYVDNIAVDVSLSNPNFETTAFKAYPNPVKDVLHLSYSQEITEVAVFNMVGQQVIATSIRDSKGQIDLSALPSGTYVVKARTADSSVKTLKVIKQ